MSTTTTYPTVTDDQISALLQEAEAAGDTAQVGLCRLAISGSLAARRLCERAIASAVAMMDDDDA